MIRKKPTVGLYTLGCKVSQYETEAIAEEFSRQGYEVRDFYSECDFYVINTCTVTAESDRKSRQIIRRALKYNPKGKVLVCGCYSQRSPEEVAKIEGVCAVIGSDNKLSLPKIASSLTEGEVFVSVGTLDGASFEKMRINGAPRTRVYVKIEDGCEAKCAYCAIPSARGRVRSKARCDVISEVEALSRSGTREIVLTGIETGSYGADFEESYRLSDLLRELDERRSAERIRLGSLAPELVGEAFAEGIIGLSTLAPHFHISVQSGSDNVLRGMRRRYSRETALKNIRRLKEYIPGAMFTTDLMVGFPGETEEDFLETVSFVKEARFLDAHVFSYSKRKDTPAASFDCQVSDEIKARRSEELISVVAEVRNSVLREILERGEPLSCIFESVKDNRWLGHSASFVEVVYDGKPSENLHGEIKNCRPIAIKNGRMLVDII